MLRRILFLLALVAAAAMPARSQDAAQNPDPRHIVANGFDKSTDISSYWLVQTGDDPAWASPNYDDSSWQLRTKSDSLSKYWKRPARRVWYRLHAEVPPNTQDLAITINGIHGPFELYVNGRPMGEIGTIDGPGTFGDMVADVFKLPADIAPDGHLVIALRTAIFFTPQASQGGLGRDALIKLGSIGSLKDERELGTFESLSSNYTNMLIAFIGSIVAFGLYLSARAQREYLDLALSFVATFVYAAYEIYAFADNVERSFWPTLIFSTLTILPAIFLVEFSRRLIGRPFFKLFAIFEGILLLVQAIFPAVFILSPAHLSSLVAGIPAGIGQITAFVFLNAIVPAILFREWRKGNKDAGLILLATSGSLLFNYLNFVRSILAATHVIDGQNNPLQRIPGIAFNIAWSEIATFITSMVLLVFIILRTIRIAREKAELAGEIAAAQNVQELLLARASRPTPGFNVETAYKPASEVGGDFFLVSPGEDGSLFAIVGDVSGKGMQAAMRVSLILGVLQRESSRAPAQVLMNLNRALLTQGDIGFTTACALLIHADGRFSFSNAGHLNPYVDGQELVSPGALPLGLATDFDYQTEYGHLDRGQRMVLLSDGVPEARSAATGDLYGFDKLVTLTRLPASDIAETAHIFGQTDDITVLTLALA